MTLYVFGTSINGPQSMSTGDRAWIAKDVTVGSSGTTIGGVSNIRVDNFGNIVGGIGVWLGAASNPAGSINNTIVNYASGQIWGISSIHSAGVIYSIGNNGSILNQGLIHGVRAGIDFSDVEPTGTNISSITNSGTIEAEARDGINVYSSGLLQLTITNSGIIRGPEHSISVWTTAANGDHAKFTITNKGLLDGDLKLGTGADFVDSRLGTIVGAIDLGAGTDRIYAGKEANIIGGGAGLDYLAGGLGNDTYIINRAVDGLVTDSVVEGANAGIDTVRFTANAAGQSYTLGANVEGLTLLGGLASNGIGNALANRIAGNASANAIYGGRGLDILTGGAGNDQFVFNTAPSAANVDRITDFSVPGDTIRLENAIFTKILGAAGASIGALQFWKSATGLAHDANDRIIYETDTGKIFYDSNGKAAGGAIQIATIGANLGVTHADFFII